MDQVLLVNFREKLGISQNSVTHRSSSQQNKLSKNVQGSVFKTVQYSFLLSFSKKSTLWKNANSISDAIALTQCGNYTESNSVSEDSFVRMCTAEHYSNIHASQYWEEQSENTRYKGSKNYR